MSVIAFVMASFTAPEEIGTNPQSLLMLLPLVAAIAVVYQATKLPTIRRIEKTLLNRSRKRSWIGYQSTRSRSGLTSRRSSMMKRKIAYTALPVSRCLAKGSVKLSVQATRSNR